MDIIIGIVIGIVIMSTIGYISYRKGEDQIRIWINDVENRLCTRDITDGINNVKELCRNTKGLHAYLTYVILDTIQKKL